MKAIILTTFLALIMADSAFGQDQTINITTTGQGENLQKATDNALRSAIEQTFGAFISSRTEILNDQLVSDQIASVASGNIQSYEVLAQTRLSENLWGVTLRAVVSVTKLTSFVQSRGVQVEIQGGLFAANIRQQILNEEAEIEAVRNMVGVLHELFLKAFNYKVQAGSPVATDATSSNWRIPLTITATANENMELASLYLQNTLRALGMSRDEIDSYKDLNKDVYVVEFGWNASLINVKKEGNYIYTGINWSGNLFNNKKKRNNTIALRREQSFEMLIDLMYNINKNYTRLYVVESGLDLKYSPGRLSKSNAYVFTVQEVYRGERFYHGFLSFFNGEFLWYNDDARTKIYPASHIIDDKYVGIIFLSKGQVAATLEYDDLRTLNEISKLTGYFVKPAWLLSN